MQTKTGDSVKVRRIGGALRLDVGDAEALQGLVYEATARALGALVGVGSGCLYVPTFNTADLGNVVVGECVLFWAYPAGGSALRNAEGMVLRHNPSLSGQVSTVNLTPYAAGEGLPYLWARRVEIETSPGARKKAVTPPFAEVDDNTATRYEERVEFEVGTANPDPAEGWFAFARVTAWGGGVPTIRGLSPFDTGDDGMPSGGGVRHRILQEHGFRDFSLRGLITAALVQLARIEDSSWGADIDGTVTTPGTYSWVDELVGVRGRLQLHNDLAALEAKPPGLLWSGRIDAAGAIEAYVGKAGATVTKTLDGGSYQYSVRVPGSTAGAVTGITITPAYSAAHNVAAVASVSTDGADVVIAYWLFDPGSLVAGVEGAHYVTINGVG